MIRLISLGAVAMLALGIFLTLGSKSAHAAPPCNDALVAGVYGSDFDGFFNQARKNGKTQIFVQKPIRGVAIITLTDGAGNADNPVEVLIKGFIADTPQISQDGPEVIEFTGTWSVDNDCTGEIDLVEFDAVVDWVFVAVKDVTELFIISNPSLSKAHAIRL